jgi:hypothetical protein
MAVFVWGRPRFTADIDIVIVLQLENVAALAEALRSLSEATYIDEASAVRAIQERNEFNFVDWVSGVKVDFWVAKDDPFEKEKFRRRVRRRVLKETIHFISPEDLILAKLLWNKENASARQFEDIESVLIIQKRLDRRYLRKWAKIHGTLPVLEELLAKVQK